MLDLERIVGRVGEILRDGPLELATSSRGRQGLQSAEILVFTLAKDEGGGSVVSWAVGDGVGLARLDGGREVVDLDGEGSSDEGRAGEEGLEETHVDSWGGLVIRRYYKSIGWLEVW